METGNKLEFNDLPSDIRLKFDYLDTLVLNSYNRVLQWVLYQHPLILK